MQGVLSLCTLALETSQCTYKFMAGLQWAQLIAYGEEGDGAPTKGKVTTIRPQNCPLLVWFLLGPLSFRKCMCHSSQGKDSYHPGRGNMDSV